MRAELPIVTMTDDEISAVIAAVSGRSCGPCQECCESIAVRELGKPYHKRCVHQCESGCGVYPTRPVSCREYACVWLVGGGNKEDRPDLSKVLVEANVESSDGRLYADAYVLGQASSPEEARSRYNTTVRLVRHLTLMLESAGERPEAVRLYPAGLHVLSQWDADANPEHQRNYAVLPVESVSIEGLPIYQYRGPAREDGELVARPEPTPGAGV